MPGMEEKFGEVGNGPGIYGIIIILKDVSMRNGFQKNGIAGKKREMIGILDKIGGGLRDVGATTMEEMTMMIMADFVNEHDLIRELGLQDSQRRMTPWTRIF